MSKTVQDLEAAFDDWLQTIVDVLKIPMPKIDKSLNAGKIGDYTLEDYETIIDNEILAHINAINPHNLTLSQLGVLSTEEIYDLLSLYQNKFRIPLTLIPNLNGKVSASWSANTLTIAKVDVTILGSTISIPTSTVTMNASNVQYLILTATMGEKDFSASYSVSTTPTVSFTKIPIVKITKNTQTVNTRTIVRIGENELSRTPIGTTIPVSDGNTQAATGTIGSNWFK